MRKCPVCNTKARKERWRMGYKIPDGFPLPDEIVWYTCNGCGMVYGDGDFSQSDLNKYYQEDYGYGVNSPENIKRLKTLATWINQYYMKETVIVDFGGDGDDGSELVKELGYYGFYNAKAVGAGDAMVKASLIIVSHVLEHVYDMDEVMGKLVDNLRPNGTIIVDGPESADISTAWPIMDYNTKHINHFVLRNYLELFGRYGFEMTRFDGYKMNDWVCYQLHFKHESVAIRSKRHIRKMTRGKVKKMRELKQPVNIWGLGDVTWHLLHLHPLEVLDYIDNDPAFRGRTYDGKPILEKPTNDAPIVIMAQGQRTRLIENIRKMGVENEIIEI